MLAGPGVGGLGIAPTTTKIRPPELDVLEDALSVSPVPKAMVPLGLARFCRTRSPWMDFRSELLETVRAPLATCTSIFPLLAVIGFRFNPPDVVVTMKCPPADPPTVPGFVVWLVMLDWFTSTLALAPAAVNVMAPLAFSTPLLPLTEMPDAFVKPMVVPADNVPLFETVGV